MLRDLVWLPEIIFLICSPLPDKWLFNRNLNVLGNAEHARLEELPLERFNVEEIPLDGEIVEEHAGFTDVFFYTDLTSPYAGYALNLQKLKAYNRFMFPLAMALNRKL